MTPVTGVSKHASQQSPSVDVTSDDDGGEVEVLHPAEDTTVTPLAATIGEIFTPQKCSFIDR